MPWITPIETDVYQTLNPAEIDEYRTRRAAEHSDPMAGLIADTVAHVRGFVAGVADISRHPGIPHSLKNAAMDIVVYRLAKRCQMSTEQQRKPAADDAQKLLELVARGEIGLDIVEAGNSTGRWGSAPRINT